MGTGLNIFLIVFAAMYGSCVGSFLNVVVWRLPNGLSLVRPGSFCPKCSHPIRFYDNIPVFGWLFLRGKCRDCHAPISMRYPLIEFICGAAAAVFAALIFAGQWHGFSGAFFWDGLGEWIRSLQSAEAGESYFALASPEMIIAAGLGMTALWSSFFYLLLAVGLIEWDGLPVPKSLLMLTAVLAVTFCASLFFRTDPSDPLFNAAPIALTLGIVKSTVIPGFLFLPLFYKQYKEWLVLCLFVGPVLGGGWWTILAAGIFSIPLCLLTKKRAPGLFLFAVGLAQVLFDYFGILTI